MRIPCLLLMLATITSFSPASPRQESSMGQELKPLRLMPWPSELKTSTGQMLIDPSFSVAIHGSDPRLKTTVAIFLDDLRRHTGVLPLDFSINDHPQAGHPLLSVTSEHASKEVQELGEDESYQLNVTPSGAELIAPTTLGVMRGLETFLQLVEITPNGFASPAVN